MSECDIKKRINLLISPSLFDRQRVAVTSVDGEDGILPGIPGINDKQLFERYNSPCSVAFEKVDKGTESLSPIVR